MLREDTLLGHIDKVETAIERLQAFEPPEGYILAFSGGKDSCVIKDLAIRSGVKFTPVYNITTVDPPELLRFINAYHGDVVRMRPKKNMWDLIVENGGPPYRHIRYCCEELKESQGSGYFITGVRAAESKRRSLRAMSETCKKYRGKRFLHPIIDWTDSDVWQYLKQNKVPYCSLYDEGWKRLGCILCPMSNQQRERERWPKIAALYLNAFRKAYEKRLADGKSVQHDSAEEWFEFWISGKSRKKDIPDQMMLFE